MQFSQEILKRCWFLAGPTACGKSEISLQLAESLSAEIVALDSMSLYRGMDVGTAKPSPEARETVPHHLIDILDPHQEFSLAEYVEAAHNSCKDIIARDRTPLFVGGTGLYLRGVLRGVFDGPPADWEFRRQIQAEESENEPGFLHQRLQKLDPSSAAWIHPHDERRVIRALEVLHVTGQPLSEQQQQKPLPREQQPQHVYWLLPPRDWLYQRIVRRVVEMMQEGLVDEVKRLVAATDPMSRTAQQALGYKEVIDFLNGQGSLQECTVCIQTRTRQFAKRQHTWFRNLEECVPITMDGTEDSQQLANRILAQAKSSDDR